MSRNTKPISIQFHERHKVSRKKGRGPAELGGLKEHQDANLPIVCNVNFVKIFAALLAKVFIRGALGAEYADAGAVLPNFANVALNEEACNVFGEFNSVKEFGIRAIHKWTSRIFFRATRTPDGLVLFVEDAVTAICHV